ncbi:MAG: APC family permease [Dehalococcoidia bacterium]
MTLRHRRAPPSPAPPSPGPGLRRALGFWEVTAGGVGIIIGAGIYVLVGAATERAGAAVWVAFVLAAVLSALTGLSYAELASMFPSAGAEYEYTRRAFPHWLAFTVGWVMVAGLVVAAAAVSLGFGRYLDHFLPLDSRIGALGLLALVAGIAVVGIKQSVRVTVALSVVQVGGLVAIILIGAPHVGEVDLLESTGPVGILGAAALVFFAFIGFDEVITRAEETHDPTRTVPRALLTALAISTVLYVAVAVAAVSVLGAAALGASSRPLADVMAHVATPARRRW